MNIISRIHRFIPRRCCAELKAICYSHTIGDNNKKVEAIREVLTRYEIPFAELSPGTNRYGIKIDGYVFKIAMDKDGIRDNRIEFAMSEEIQPYVSKTYECNDILIVSEYVTHMSKEEFQANEEVIKGILSQLAPSYIFGDIGYTLKNYVNWGYRANGELVILDYGYIYRIMGQEARCNKIHNDKVCGEFLEYNENFTALVCPKCHAKYSYMDIRKRIDLSFENKYVDTFIKDAYLMTSESAAVDDDDDVIDNNDEPITEVKEEYIEKEESSVFDGCETIDDIIAKTDEILARGRAMRENPDQMREELAEDCCCMESYEEDYDSDIDCAVSEYEDVIYSDDTFQLAYIGNTPVLYTEERYTNPIIGLPKDMTSYHIRLKEGLNEWESLESNVFSSFGGTIICDSCGIVDITKGYEITEEEMTIDEFMKFCNNTIINEPSQSSNEYESIYDFDDDEPDNIIIEGDSAVIDCDVSDETEDESDDDDNEEVNEEPFDSAVIDCDVSDETEDESDDDDNEEVNDEPFDSVVIDSDALDEDTSDNEEIYEPYDETSEEEITEEEESDTCVDVDESISTHPPDISESDDNEYYTDPDEEYLRNELTVDNDNETEETSSNDINVHWSEADDVSDDRNELLRQIAEEEEEEERKLKKNNYYKRNKRW